MSTKLKFSSEANVGADRSFSVRTVFLSETLSPFQNSDPDACQSARQVQSQIKDFALFVLIVHQWGSQALPASCRSMMHNNNVGKKTLLAKKKKSHLTLSLSLSRCFCRPLPSCRPVFLSSSLSSLPFPVVLLHQRAEAACSLTPHFSAWQLKSAATVTPTLPLSNPHTAALSIRLGPDSIALHGSENYLAAEVADERCGGLRPRLLRSIAPGPTPSTLGSRKSQSS